MGEWVGVSVKNFDFISRKNQFDDLLLLFSKEDLHTEEEACDGEKYVKRYFSTTILKAKQILDATGHTLQEAKIDFERDKREKIEYIEYLIEKGERTQASLEEFQGQFTFENWASAVKKYARILANDTFNNQCEFEDLKKEKEKRTTLTEKVVLDSLPFGDEFWGLDFEIVDYWNIFRVILEAFDLSQSICLDYTNLYEGGWCDEVPKDEEFEVEKTIVLTEGKFDSKTIAESIKLLYPHLSKCYSFIDFSGYKIQGSTSFLTHYLKMFIASGIKNKIIAIYDNDAAGRAEMLGLQDIRKPKNFKIKHLPNISIADNYPTLGPNGRDVMDINGKACSIELFLGSDVLKKGDDFYPIQWKGYVEKVATYQGEIINKGEVQERFELKLSKAKAEGIIWDEWNEMDKLLQMIFKAFNEDE